MKSLTSVVILILSVAICLFLVSQADCYQDSNEEGILALDGDGKCLFFIEVNYDIGI